MIGSIIQFLWECSATVKQIMLLHPTVTIIITVYHTVIDSNTGLLSSPALILICDVMMSFQRVFEAEHTSIIPQ